MSLQAMFMVASAFVIFALGTAHLWFTFVGARLQPRSDECRSLMEATHPTLTRQTTIWRAWVGFNASHSFGAMFFGLIYSHLAIRQPAMLFGSPFLLAVGACLLIGYAVLGKLYWFSVPYIGILLAATLYLASLISCARAS